MISVFWLVNIRVDENDFTKAYATVLLVPLSGSTISKFWSIVNSVAGVPLDYSAYGQISYFLVNLYGALITTSQLYVMIGTAALMLLLIMTALQQRRIVEMDRAWLAFATILITTLTLGSLNYFMDPAYRGIPKFMIALVVICTSAVLVVLLVTDLLAIYFSPRKCSSKDVVLADAWYRLVFASAASSIALFPCCYSLWHVSIHFLTRGTTFDDDVRAEWLWRILQFFTGLIILPTIFAFRPYTYACALMLNIRKIEKKTSIAPTNLIQAPQLTYAPVPPFAKVRNPEH
ncbi:unnamed protein product [Haemonchus placei]|uniref:G_PROTEIN_RECEP_F1_2 domain-containing protein n=1 Tax=Haemonchus placei TaxID=6290 RepID=A0A158QND2_HAEPC|nr:unnamed protein product [Haemonchus placei]